VKTRTFAFVACVLAAGARPCVAQSSTLHPPAALIAALGELHEVDTLGGLPTAIRGGTFALTGDGKAVGWVLAEPGGKWNPTDTIVDTSLPGRRMIVALCNASACALSYERGGIAHVYFVAAFVRNGAAWKMDWLGQGNRATATASALATLLRTRSATGYHDDPNPGRDY
jgi:hypothetical protein